MPFAQSLYSVLDQAEGREGDAGQRILESQDVKGAVGLNTSHLAAEVDFDQDLTIQVPAASKRFVVGLLEQENATLN